MRRRKSPREDGEGRGAGGACSGAPGCCEVAGTEAGGHRRLSRVPAAALADRSLGGHVFAAGRGTVTASGVCLRHGWGRCASGKWAGPGLPGLPGPSLSVIASAEAAPSLLGPECCCLSGHSLPRSPGPGLRGPGAARCEEAGSRRCPLTALSRVGRARRNPPPQFPVAGWAAVFVGSVFQNWTSCSPG